MLHYPVIWAAARSGVDWAFGVYRKRLHVMRTWGVLDARCSILDIGCGTGQYSCLPASRYTGLDLNSRYIDYARKEYGQPGRSFQCLDVRTLLSEQAQFDLILMVDFLHHLADDDCTDVLRAAARMARQAVLSFEPVTQQTNPIGQWIIDHDRGQFVRPLARLHALVEQSGLAIDRHTPLMLGPIRTEALLCRPTAGTAAAAAGGRASELPA
jgi:2-polyprenyl-3-methyl-5-hydroxy-6-metoxy-1,4-benzoquinol methylase